MVLAQRIGPIRRARGAEQKGIHLSDGFEIEGNPIS